MTADVPNLSAGSPRARIRREETPERPRGVRTRVLKQLLMTQEKMAHKIEELEHLLAGARGGGQHDGL